jgi:NAD(P)-dependent dehydrogenase (short-subunit alcohol dehydrogenase family)
MKRRKRKDLTGKKVLVTGAASGIGKATAAALAAKGAKLVLTDIRAEDLERTAADLGTGKGNGVSAPVIHSAAADVRDYDAIQGLADEVHERHGSLDVVMNIAGVSTWGSVDRLRHSDWQRMIDVNLMGPIHVIEAFVPPMMAARNGGHLVNVSSAAGILGLPWHAAYSASKFGLRGISEVLRFDLRRHRIGVTLVCPGGVDTPLVQSVDIVGIDRDHAEVQKLVKRFRSHAATPEKVADAIINGVEKRKELVFTGPDIHAAYLLQRYFPPGYDAIMNLMQAQLVKIGEAAALPATDAERRAPEPVSPPLA